MRKIKMLLATALVCLAMPMSAQFSNNSSSSSVASSADTPDSYSRFSVGYNSNTFSTKNDDNSFNGFAVQLLAGKKISDTMPFYVEYGGRLTMGFWSDDKYDDDARTTKLSVSVPVNLTYRINISETACISPYAGFHMIGNIIGSAKKEIGSDERTVTFNMFDKDDVGKDGQWTRLQYGMQVGTNISFDKFNIGLEYSFDFNDICKKVSTSDFMVSVGFNF